jgi:RNA polymerase sigma factor (sigma-70 family)
MHSKRDTALQTVFADAYQQYASELRRRARFMISDAEASEDIVQDVFMRAWKYMVGGGKVDSARAFLHRVLNNAVVDMYRKHRTSSLDAYVEKGYEPSTDDSERLMDQLDGEKALLLIKQLPAKYQKVLHMKYENGLSCQEISHCTGQSRNTVSVQAHRALERLRILYMMA